MPSEKDKLQTIKVEKIHSATEKSSLKAQNISLLTKLHFVNMQLYQK